MSEGLEVEEMNMVYICEICDKLFSSNALLREHHQSHIVSKPYKCDICHSTFSHPKELRVHISIHDSDKSTPTESESKTNTVETVDGSSEMVVLGSCENIEENGLIQVYVESETLQTELTDKVDNTTEGDDASPWSSLYPLLVSSQSSESSAQPETVQIVVEEVENVEGVAESIEDMTEIVAGIAREPQYRKLGKMRYQCLICNQIFTQVSHIKSHHISHTGEKSFRCDDCDTTFTTLSSLRRHFGRFGHGQSRPDKAELRDKCNEEVLKDPSVKKVLESLAFDKDLLNQKNSTSRELLKKVQIDLTNSNKSETKLSETASSPAVDMVEENGNSTQTEKSFILKCGNCEIFGPKKCRIHAYIYKQLPFKCRLCTRYFKKYYELQKHRIKHFSKVKQPYYKCGICDSEFNKISMYAIHMRSHPLARPLKPINLKTIINDVVIKSSSRKFYIADERPYKCFVCFKRFKSKTNLKGHSITHQSIKPYICSECKTGFTTISSLNRHQYRFSHTGQVYDTGNTFVQKPKAIKTPSLAKKSSKTRRNPFTCKHCNVRFLLKLDYQKHYKEVHSEFICDICNRCFKSESSLENHELRHFEMVHDGEEWKLILKRK